jgi:heat shock protein HtpX
MLANFAFFFSLGGREDEREAPLGAAGAILMAVLAPIAAMLVLMAISRTREFAADRAGAEMSGNPEWLASALRKIETYAERARVPDAERNPATAHLFIVNPLRSANLATLFASHPATEERVRRLEAMAAARGIGSGAHAAAGAGPWGARRPA